MTIKFSESMKNRKLTEWEELWEKTVRNEEKAQ